MPVLLLDNAIPLKGFYRIRPGQPGFAIPVFENNGQLVVQHVDRGGTIDGFLPCDLDVDQLLPVPKDIGAEPLDSRVGAEPLYGFQNLDGTLIYGSRDKLLPLLRPVLAQLADRPFLSLEIAQFLEDETLINENRARTQPLLRRHTRDPIVPTLPFFDRLFIMRLFLSYASEDRNLAEQIHHALATAGYDVFFDRASLQPGGDYNSQIRKEIISSDLFIFLISRHSVTNRYTLTELNFAQKKWRSPKGGVLPVMLSDTDYEAIPNYLKAITILQPSGYAPAEVVYEVRRIANKRKKFLVAAPIGGLLVVALITVFLMISNTTNFYYKKFVDNFAVIQIITAVIGAAGAIIAAYIPRLKRKIEKNEVEEGGSTTVTRIRRFTISNVFIFFLAPLLGMIAGWELGKAVTGDASEIEAPFEVIDYFYPSGWMGEGEEGEKYIQLNDQWRQNCHSAPTCTRVSYRPDKKGWAGIYWQYPNSNWGDSPGRRIKGAKRLTFWTRGEKGGELVQFKAGGINAPGKKYHDSFEKAIGPVDLKQEWQRYEIDLAGADLSSVLGAFVWMANRNGNPEGLTFYLDDIRYE